MSERDMGVTFPPVRKLLIPPASWPPTLVVVIDTEEEFDWAAPFDPASTGVSNVLCQGLAQNIFDSYRLVPTYVIDYPVANDPKAVDVLARLAADRRCEIGAHLHPWVN